MIREILSASNPALKELVKIKNDARFRESGKIVLIEGEKLISDAAEVTPLICLLSTDEARLKKFKARESYLITPPLLKKISSSVNPDGLLAVVEMPSYRLPKVLTKLLVLDRLQDPGNLGTLIRSAYAMNWDAVFLLEGTVDPFNDKALRAAKGATFRLPLMKGNITRLKEVLAEFSLTSIAADMKGALLGSVALPKKIALILGNEGRGLSPELLDGATTLSIPMREGADSLNVATSGAIFMYELGK